MDKINNYEKYWIKDQKMTEQYQYVSLSFSIEDIEKIEDIAADHDSTIASMIRGMVKHILSDPELTRLVKPVRKTKDRKRKK